MLLVRNAQIEALRSALRPTEQIRARLAEMETPFTAGRPADMRAVRVNLALTWAVSRGLSSEAALAAYAALVLEFGPAFHVLPRVGRLLRDAPDPDAAATQLARSLRPGDWAAIARRAADHTAWEGEEDWSA